MFGQIGKIKNIPYPILFRFSLCESIFKPELVRQPRINLVVGFGLI